MPTLRIAKGRVPARFELSVVVKCDGMFAKIEGVRESTHREGRTVFLQS